MIVKTSQAANVTPNTIYRLRRDFRRTLSLGVLARLSRFARVCRVDIANSKMQSGIKRTITMRLNGVMKSHHVEVAKARRAAYRVNSAMAKCYRRSSEACRQARSRTSIGPAFNGMRPDRGDGVGSASLKRCRDLVLTGELRQRLFGLRSSFRGS